MELRKIRSPAPVVGDHALRYAWEHREVEFVYILKGNSVGLSWWADRDVFTGAACAAASWANS